MKPVWTKFGCVVLAAIWIWAGASKLMNPDAFAKSMMGFNLVSWPGAAGLALYLPWLEVITAAGLLTPRLRPGALLVSVTLFVVFTAIWAVTWSRGIDVACGCFGGEGRTNAAWGFARALGLAVAAGVLWRSACTSKPGAAERFK